MSISALNNDDLLISYHPPWFRSLWIDLFTWNLLFNENASHKLIQNVAALTQPIDMIVRLYINEELAKIMWTARSVHMLVPSFTVSKNSINETVTSFYVII